MPSWQVLLIAGCSGSGKTRLAEQLGRSLQVSVMQADDVRIALQRIVRPPRADLHAFVCTPDIWQRPPEELARLLVAVGEVVSEAVRDIIGHHVITNHPLILEGDGLLPAVAADCIREYGSGHVRAVLVDEPELTALEANMRARGRGFLEQPEDLQATQVRMSWCYANWLRAEARRHGLPVVAARPFGDLAERVLLTAEPSR